MTTTNTVQHLLTGPVDKPVLLGSCCRDCGEHYFPIVGSCTRCCSENLVPCELGSEGALWSWTIQSFLPKEPYNSGETVASFQPYGVGYIQMSCGVKVESRLTVADPDRLKIGMSMKLVTVAYGADLQGNALHTYAFAPADEENT